MVDTTLKAPGGAGLHDLLEMWRALLHGAWGSLAVVPSDEVVSVRLVVEALNAVRRERGDQIEVFDARGFDLDQGRKLSSEVGSALLSGRRAVVVVDSLMRSLAGAQVVRDTNAVLLVIRVGGLDHESLASTIDLVGPGRVVGAVSSGGEA